MFNLHRHPRRAKIMGSLGLSAPSFVPTVYIYSQVTFLGTVLLAT